MDWTPTDYFTLILLIVIVLWCCIKMFPYVLRQHLTDAGDEFEGMEMITTRSRRSRSESKQPEYDTTYINF